MSEMSFRDAYALLQRSEAEMREMKDPNVDALIPLVEQAIASHAVCKARIEAVRTILNQKLGGQQGS